MAQQHIAGAGFKFPRGKAHRLRAIAATTALVKHQRAMFFLQPLYQVQRRFCGNNSFRSHKTEVVVIKKHRGPLLPRGARANA